jgi:uncharacterized DUF497 family protein
MIQFEWDEHKNQSNIRKHKVSFEDAKTIFDDPNGLLIHDPDHSDDEDPFYFAWDVHAVKSLNRGSLLPSR